MRPNSSNPATEAQPTEAKPQGAPIYSRAAFVVGGLLLSAIAWLVRSNPPPLAYERYATKQLATHLKTETCRQAYQIATGVPPALAAWGCRWLVDAGQPGLEFAVRQTTERRNYVLFSLYHTQVGPQTTWPNYRQTTLAIGNSFIPLQGGWHLGDRPLKTDQH